MPPLANSSVGSDGLHTPWQFGPRSSLPSRVPEPLLPCMQLYIVFSSWLEYILFLPLSVSKFLGPLYSLRLFLENIIVHSIRLNTIDRPEIVENALAALRRERNKHSIIVLEGRETQGSLTQGSLKSDEIDILLTTLNAD